MNILSDILDTIDLEGVLYFRTVFSSPWAVEVPKLSQAARFHLVVQGSCLLKLSDGTTTRLERGDLALIPRGRSHTLSCVPVQQAPLLETVLEDAGYTGDGVLIVGAPSADNDSATTQLICGHLNFRNGGDHPILRGLPDFIHASGTERAQYPFLDDLLRLVERQVFSGRPGSAASVKRLSEMVFIEILNISMEEGNRDGAIFQAFSDPQIGKSLALIHDDPAAKWSVETLANHVGMSRSRFAERFNTLLGTGPMSYVSDWRLQKALSLLDETQLDVKQIAHQVGYQSKASFTRAFSAKHGHSPMKYRRRSDAGPQA